MKKIYLFILTMITIGAIVFGFFKYIYSTDKSISFSEEYGKNVENIVIDGSLMNIKLKEGDSFGVDYSGSEKLCPKVEYSTNSKTITIKQPDNKNNRKAIREDNDLTVFIPANTKLTSFAITLSLGDVSLGNLSADTITIDSALGSLEASSIVADKINVVANLGDINLGKCDCKDIDIEANLGNIEIDVDGNLKDFSITAEASLGNISIGSDSYKGNFSQTGNAGTIKVKCDLGNVTVE